MTKKKYKCICGFFQMFIHIQQMTRKKCQLHAVYDGALFLQCYKTY